MVHTEIVGLHQDLKNVWCKTQEPHKDELPIDGTFQIKESPSREQRGLSLQEALKNIPNTEQQKQQSHRVLRWEKSPSYLQMLRL